MANYFVINNKFRPYSFDELIKPYQMYAEQYDKQEALLSQLEGSAATMEAALSQTNDPVAYQTYTNYINNVRSAADALATRGLNADVRRRASNLTADYNKNITPIETAYKRRKELQDEQRKALLANPTLYYQRNFNDISNPETSLDRFIENPNYDYGNFFSGALLEKQVADAASTLAKELTNYGNGKRLDAYTKTWLQQHGFTREQVLEAINNPNSETASPVLNAIVNSVIQSSGIPEWNDAAALKKAYTDARRGLFAAVGQTTVNTYDDYGAKLQAQLENEKALLDHKAKIAADQQAAQAEAQAQLAINPLNFYSPAEQSEGRANLNAYSKYFTVDDEGNFTLTDEGKAEYNRQQRIAQIPIGTAGGVTIGVGEKGPSDFRKFADSITGGDISKLNAAMSLYNAQYANDHSDIYDATKNTEFDYRYVPEQQDDIKESIITAAQGHPLEEVEYDSKSHSWKPTGKTLSLTDLASNDMHVTNARMSEIGSQVIVQDKSGNTMRVRMPGGINTTNENNRDASLGQAYLYRQALIDGKYTNKAEFNDLYDKYVKALTSAYLYHSQIGLGNKTKPQEFNPYAF